MEPTSEQLEIQALARDFADAELRPRSAEWDREGALDGEVFAKLADLGFMGMLVPEEHGGLGFDFSTYALVLEELARGDAAVALSVATHNGPVGTLLDRHGTEEQKARWLPVLAAGEVIGAFAATEAGAGSDVSALETVAVPDGDGWRLTGTKKWVTNGARGGLVVVLARTGAEDVSAFLVQPEAEGYRVGKRERTLGLRASETMSVELDGVLVGPEGLVGEPGEGFHYVLEALDVARMGTASQAVGIGRAAMEHAAEYAGSREQFGAPIASFGAIREKLAGMAQRLAAARALVLEAAVALDANRDGTAYTRTGLDGVTARAAIAKLTASEAATWVADEAIQVFGGYGYMRHYPVEKLLRDAKGTEIYEGTSEIMRYVIARELLREHGGSTGSLDATA